VGEARIIEKRNSFRPNGELVEIFDFKLQNFLRFSSNCFVLRILSIRLCVLFVDLLELVLKFAIDGRGQLRKFGGDEYVRRLEHVAVP
jgi:hypothetical protein